MGNRAKSSIGYGIELEEGEFCPYELDEKLINLDGVSCMATSGSDAANCAFIYIDKSIQRSDWDDSVVIDMHKMHKQLGWDAALVKACRVLGIEYTTPEFRLSSYWG